MASARTFTAYKPMQKEVHLEKIRACEEGGGKPRSETRHEFTQCAGDADPVVTSSPQGHGSSSLYLLCREHHHPERQVPSFGTIHMKTRSSQP